MKFKVLPTVFALIIIGIVLWATSINMAATDGADVFGYPFRFYHYNGSLIPTTADRRWFSYPYLLTDLIIALLFTCLVNLLFALILNKNRLKQTAI